uniref:Uncharacterized protein n=1 Tax=Anguilla anguilla TaxID=7936 RepID=A0A0E9PQX5_ANGAN
MTSWLTFAKQTSTENNYVAH